jgi:hypothetical protein
VVRITTASLTVSKLKHGMSDNCGDKESDGFGLLGYVVCYIVTTISEEHTASTVRSTEDKGSKFLLNDNHFSGYKLS